MTEKESVLTSKSETISTSKILSQKPNINTRISENQRKVIKDKYLRAAPSVEYWLWGVAWNIALAELLYNPEISKEKIFTNVRNVRKEIIINDELKTELVLVHEGSANYKEQDENHKEFIKNLYDSAKTKKGIELVQKTAKKFYKMLANWEFLPNSPTLMNAGRDLQQLSACYVLPIEDSIEGWGDVVKHTMQIHKGGGGTGFSGCRVRPRGDIVKTTKGMASGAISPFQIINYATQEVKQGGTRRGANMGILPYWHPDILQFITAKAEEGRLENFNISVALDNEFIQSLKENDEYELINPKSKAVAGKLKAEEVFQKISEFAWKTGDPGVVFLDKINESCSNPTPELGRIEATNPCGEQPLLPYEPCNLGSINLSKFVKEGEVCWKQLGETVKLATRFLDNVIDVNNYPLPQIEKLAKGNRRIGLGVMGWAEMLVLLGISYDSKEALVKAEEVMSFINKISLETSEELAKERGVFPNFKNSIYDKEAPNFKEWADAKPRNCARTTIAPTGTIAIAAGLQGSGIEPFFSIVYERYNAKALDAIRKGEKPNENDIFHEVNPLFLKTAKEYEYFGLEEKELWKKIDSNHKSVRGLKEIPEHIQRLFASAHDVAVDWHVRIQATFQKHVDNGVSKTINLSNSATVEDIKKTYLMAYELGCKGITVYRDGCKKQQVLNLQSKIKEEKKIDLQEGISSKYYKFHTGYGPVHIHLDHLDDKIIRIFTNTTPIGTEIAGLTAALGIMISKYLEKGGDAAEVRKYLNSIKSDRPHGFGPSRIESIPHAVSVAITKFLRQTGKLPVKGQTELSQHTKKQQTRRYCPECYSPNIAFLSGCSGPTCFDCGHAECS